MQHECETSFKFPLNLNEYFDALDKGLNDTTSERLLPFKVIKKNFNISWNYENSLQEFAFLKIIDQHINSKSKCSKCSDKSLTKLRHYLNLYTQSSENSTNIRPTVIFRSVHDVTSDLNHYSFQVKFITKTEVNYFLLDRDLVIGQNKTAVEFSIECAILLLQFKSFLSDSDSVIRNYGYLHFKSSCCGKPILMRLALERKFTAGKIGQDKCFLHVEWEKQPNEDTNCKNDFRFNCFVILADAITASPVLSHIFKSLYHFQRQYNITQCPDTLSLLENVNLKRRYNELCSILETANEAKNERYPDRFFYCARKLDGTRHLLLLTHAAWYILNRDFIAIHGPHFLRLKFNYICHVEFIKSESCYYIIDVLQLIQLDRNRLDCKLTHQHISIIAAVQFISNLAKCHGKKILAHSFGGNYTLSFNEFKLIDMETCEYLRQINHTNIIKACRLLFTSTCESITQHTDGYILIADMQILKIKFSTTVDLRISLKNWLKKIVQNNRSQLPLSLLQDVAQYIRYNRPLKYSQKEADYFNAYIPYVGALLEYYNTETKTYEKFSSSFPNIKIDLSTLHFRSLWFRGYNGTKSNTAYNFQVLEFQFHYYSYSLRFSTVRDKPNCNTFLYISNIFNNS